MKLRLGDIVYFTSSSGNECPAIVTRIMSDTMLNLFVLEDHGGCIDTYHRNSVPKKTEGRFYTNCWYPREEQ